MMSSNRQFVFIQILHFFVFRNCDKYVPLISCSIRSIPLLPISLQTYPDIRTLPKPAHRHLLKKPRNCIFGYTVITIQLGKFNYRLNIQIILNQIFWPFSFRHVKVRPFKFSHTNTSSKQLD